MFPRKETVSITSNGDGDGTGYTGVIDGRILSVEYVKDGTSPYDNGVDFTITLATSGQAVISKSNVAASILWRPQIGVHDTVGADIADAYSPIYCAGERVKIVIDEADDTKTGTFNVVYG